jgi:hypothetical protein
MFNVISICDNYHAFIIHNITLQHAGYQYQTLHISLDIINLFSIWFVNL